MSFVPHSIPLAVATDGGDRSIMAIDHATARSLELVQGIKGKVCLFGCIDRTRTAMGRRLLRMSILQPLLDEKLIKVRQDCIEAILGAQNHCLGEALSKMPDLDSLLSALVQVPKIEGPKDAERRLQLLLSLRFALGKLKDLCNLLRESFADNLMLSTILPDELGPPGDELIPILDELLDPDVPIGSALTQEQRAFVIRADRSGDALLEVARRTFRETANDIYEYSQALQRTKSL